MSNNMTLRASLLVAAILVSALAFAACGTGEEPQDRDFDLQIADGVLNLDPAVVRVNQGDRITLNIDSDEQGTFHLHGYDIELEVGPDRTTKMEFEANAAGNYPITFHAGAGEHDEGDHGVLFESDTITTGQTFEFSITESLEGLTIPFHNPMSREMTGEINVGHDATPGEVTEIQIQADGAFVPDHVSVGSGTTIVWTNSGDDRQIVSSGPPPGEQEEDHEEGEEINIASLEVQPR